MTTAPQIFPDEDVRHMWRQCTLFVLLVLGWVVSGGSFSPVSAQSYGVCEPYRLQGSFCAQVNIYQTLLSEAYAQQPPPSSPHYNAWRQRTDCLHSLQQIAAQYCSQSGGDGTFPMCTHEYSPGWNCQALAHYTNFLSELNALPPTNDSQLLIERDRLRTCLTFIINNLQANCNGSQFNIPPFSPGDAGGIGGGGSGGAVGGGYADPGGVNVPYGKPQPGQGNPGNSSSPARPGAFGMDDCEFMSDIIDIADHCARSRLLLEKIERLQSQGRLSDFCRQRLQQMYLYEARRCEQEGGNPSGQPRPRPLKPSGNPPADNRFDPCGSLALPDVADPCVVTRYVFETWINAQQQGASPECLHKLKLLFYEKQEACRQFSQKGNSSPHLPEQPW